MKTSKKLLSLFLALVMVITSCSVGFTAFAADDSSNQTDSNNSYWNDATTSDEAFAALNNLVDGVLQISFVRNLVIDNGLMTEDEYATATIADVVEAASPKLIGLLAGMDTEAISSLLGTDIQGVKYSKKDFLRKKYSDYLTNRDKYDKWYAPLDGDEDDLLDFYTLYHLCDLHKGDGGDLGDYCTQTLAALEALFESIPEPVAKVTKQQKARTWINNIISSLSIDDTCIHADYEEMTYEGKALKNIPVSEINETDGKYYVDYYNNVCSHFGISPISNLADLIYLYKSRGFQTCLTYELYFELAGETSTELDTSRLGVDFGTAKEVADAYKATPAADPYNYDDDIFWSWISPIFGLYNEDDHDYAVFDEYFELYVFDRMLLDEYGDYGNAVTIESFNTNGDVVTPYYKEMLIGLNKKLGLTASGLEITDAQLQTLIDTATSNNWSSGAELMAYLVLNQDVISKQAYNYLAAIFSNSSNSLNGLASALNGGSLATVKAYKFTDTQQNSFDLGGIEGCIDRINAMVYAQNIVDNTIRASRSTDFINGNITSGVKIYDVYNEYVLNPDADSDSDDEEEYTGPTYEYADYAFDEDLSLEIANMLLNEFLNILDADLIKQLLAALVQSDLDLKATLTDIWINLHDAPAETVFKLLPPIVILVDEVVLPTLLHENTGDVGLIASLLQGLLRDKIQSAGDTSLGINDEICIDLNIALPAALHWLTGDYNSDEVLAAGTYATATAVDGEGKPVYNADVPRFFNIYALDVIIYGLNGSEDLASLILGLINKPDDDATDEEIAAINEKNAQLTPMVAEPIQEVLVFLRDAVDDYEVEHGEDERYGVNTMTNEIVVSQKGLNNISVALPYLIDRVGQNFKTKYNMSESDWTFTYDGKIDFADVEFADGTVKSQLTNMHFKAFKDLAVGGTAPQILAQFIDLLIGNWINSLTDFLNDMIVDENNDISYQLPLLQGLLEALGGFGEQSVITDVFNGLFQLKRADDASFTLEERETTNFVGLSNTVGYFLLGNIQFVTPAGEVHGLIPFIKGITDAPEDAQADYDLNNAFAAVAPLLANSKKSAAGTDYNKLLTSENKAAAQKLVNALDTLLSSLLANTSLNGFDFDSTDNILSGAATFASAYFGAKNTNDIVKLINDYLFFVTGENYAVRNTYNTIGTKPDKNGDVDKKKVYTSANLSNLVIQTYSLVENIVDYLFYNENNGILSNQDPNMLIADALYGIISPDAVAIRLSDEYSKTRDILQNKKYLNWNSFKVNVNYSYEQKKQYITEDYLKFGFKAGDKDAFYDALGESLSGIAGILGAVLAKSYVDANHTQNWYSNILNPIFSNLVDATGADVTVMSAADFNNAAPNDQLIQGIIAPVSGILAQIYDAPASFILNLIKGLAGVLDDDSIKGILGSVFAPITNHVDGLLYLLGDSNKLNCPTLANYLGNMINDALSGITGATSGLPDKDILVTLINNIKVSGEGANAKYVKDIITLPSIDWKKLRAASSPAEVLLLVYAYVVDTVLGSDLITGLIDSLDPSLSAMLSKLSATQILQILAEVIAVVQSPTEIYWTFSEYAGKLTNTFTYPKGITASKAEKAVDQLDTLVENIFPLLNAFGVTDIEGLGALVNDKLYTNGNITAIAKALYGAMSSNSTVAAVLDAVGIATTPAGVAAYLTDKSYGSTYSSAAATLKKAANWDKVGTVNWGFKDGSAKAQDGFINGLAAALRPLNDILSVILVEGTLDVGKLDLVNVVKSLNLSGSSKLGGDLEGYKQEYACDFSYTIKNGMATLKFRSNATQYNDNRTRQSVLEIDLVAIAQDLEKLLTEDIGKLDFGTNGYESAIVPILEAFMCDGVKTYKQYKADYKKAKDNLLIDILKPIGNFITTAVDAPFDTITAVLPNVAYFIDSSGLEQVVNNLLAPITAKDGVLGVLSKNGLDIDNLIYAITGKSLGKIVAGLIDTDIDLKLDLGNLKASNIHEIIIPLVSKLLKDKLGLTLPEFTWAQLASHGTIKTVASAARNDKGKFTTLQVQARQGETLVALLRYVADVLITNANALKKMITGIDAIKNNDTIKNIIECVFDNIATSKKDEIVLAVFYILVGDATDSFFDYRGFEYEESTFSFGDLDEDFCRQLAPMLDGLIGGLLEGGLTGLVEEKLYTDNLVAKLATGLYGAVEGVKVGDNTLTDILAMTDIDFSTSNVASLLTDGDYGRTYAAAASTIRSAGSWKNVNADNLKFGVTDRDSFLHALVAVLRPIFGVLDVILNDDALNLFNLVSIPGSDGYSSTIVPLLEAFGVYNIKTQYQYREDCYKEYDSLLLDIVNPLWDKVEDILAAPIEMVADILPNLALFFANDGLIQIVENLLTPVSELLEALEPIVNVNDVLKAAGLDVPKLLKDKVGLSVSKFDLYDLAGTLTPLVGADNVVGTINSILKTIEIGGTKLGLELPDINWLQLASRGEYVFDATSQAATFGGRIYVQADQDITLITVLRFLIDTINYKGNYDAIVDLVTGLLGDGVSDSVSDVIGQVLGMLQGDTDEVIKSLVDLLQSLAG